MMNSCWSTLLQLILGGRRNSGPAPAGCRGLACLRGGFVGSGACLPAGAGTVLAQDISKSPLVRRRGQ